MSACCCYHLHAAVQDAASSRFQLPDEDGDEAAGEGLTHMGRSLSDFDTFPGCHAMLPDLDTRLHPSAMLSARRTSTVAIKGALARCAAGK